MKPFANSTTHKNIKHECMQLLTTNVHQAYYYARDVLNKRWTGIGKPEVEDLIKQNKYYWNRYMDEVK